ncbi:hypothetical protein MRX96_001648 [Rhipicephalus microplus]
MEHRKHRKDPAGIKRATSSRRHQDRHERLSGTKAGSELRHDTKQVSSQDVRSKHRQHPQQNAQVSPSGPIPYKLCVVLADRFICSLDSDDPADDRTAPLPRPVSVPTPPGDQRDCRINVFGDLKDYVFDDLAVALRGLLRSIPPDSQYHKICAPALLSYEAIVPSSSSPEWRYQ